MDLVSQNLLMTSGGKKDPTYIDDVFSTYLWKGDGLVGRAIGNGIKLSNNNVGSSVHFDKNGDYLTTTNASSDFTMGTGDFTVECWVYIQNVSAINGFWQISPTSGGFDSNYGNTLAVAWDHQAGEGWQIYGAGTYSKTGLNVSPPSNNTWIHTAYVRSSGTSTLYIDGTAVITQADTHNYNGTYIVIGGYYSSGYLMGGYITNLRVVKGTAVYTSNFTPPTKALTNITNTKLLCCQSSTSATAATTSPTTITANGNAQAQAFGAFTANDGEGGLVWIKSRSTGNVNVLFDTVRGANERLRSDSNGAQSNADTLQPLFTNSGFTVGSGNEVNGAGNDYASWTWRKQKGFFDVVTYTGAGGTQTVNHNLGCIPGCIIIKRTDSTNGWRVYHRGTDSSSPQNYALTLSSNAVREDWTYWNDTAPTATQFTVADSDVNGNGGTYVAYVFAGGASTAATARSVSFDGSNDGLSATSSDLVLGTGDFTVECWWKYEGGNTDRIISMDKTSNPTNRWIVYHHQGNIRLNINGSDVFFSNFDMDDTITWHHLAIVKHNNKTRLYTDGRVKPSQYNPTNNEYADTLDYQSDQIHIGMEPNGGNNLNGKVSNVRVVAGTAVYTSSFIPPTEPLKNITNTKILCCNNSSVTGKTVGPTITATDSPTASTDSPFDDPEGFKFGEEGDQGIIKTGSYIGNGSNDGPEIFLGWEPQYVLVKNATSNGDWRLFDSMRGIVTGGNDPYLGPNQVNAENASNDYFHLTSTGFQMTNSYQNFNTNGDTFVYICIRRSDGYVGKPPEAGTDTFAMDVGVSNQNPNFDSGFPVGFALLQNPTSGSNWNATSRLTGTKYLLTNSNGNEANYADFTFDFNDGYIKGSLLASAYQSWMWKRGAGFDVVTDKGDGGTTKQIAHGLGVVPEMIWRKNRDTSDEWQVYHVGLNGGTNPYLWRIYFTTTGESNDQYTWDSAPTATHFTVGSNGAVNRNNQDFITYLFASANDADGNPISKVGSYTGNGSASGPIVTLGFSPRFILIKCTTGGTNWYLYDTLRGLTSGSDQRLQLNSSSNQTSADDMDPSATGFQVVSTWDQLNGNTQNYLYYAHA